MTAPATMLAAIQRSVLDALLRLITALAPAALLRFHWQMVARRSGREQRVATVCPGRDSRQRRVNLAEFTLSRAKILRYRSE
jgi:hypothetical protein